MIATGYKEYSDSYLMSLTKKDIIKQLRCAEHNFRAAEQMFEQHMENVKDWQPVKHGHWIPSPDGINPIRCSECKMPAPFAAGENEFGDFEICRYPSSYCHECGAKMDEENESNV